jgi:hypothetical protein
MIFTITLFRRLPALPDQIKITLPQGKPNCQGRAMKGLHVKYSRKTIYRITPKRKWPTRFSRIGHSPAPARYGSRNHLAALPCPVLSSMPRIISDEALEKA